MNRRATFTLVIFFTLAAFFLRLFQVGTSDFKEEEFTSLKAAAYLTYCWQDPSNCRSTPTSFRSKLVVLLTNNETRPNLFSQVYLWDFIKDKASGIHYSRAWPYLTALAGVYRWLGVSEFSSRLISVVAGGLLIPVGFVFAKYFSGSTSLSLVYSFLLVFSFPLIDMSRYARMYPPFITLFLLAVYLWHRLISRERTQFGLILITTIVTLLSYWLQSLTLLLLIGVYVYSWFKARRWFLILSTGLIGLTALGDLAGVDVFRRQYLSLAWPPHWFYLTFPVWLGLVTLALKRQAYLLTITGAYLVILVFFTDRAPAAAYVLALWPIMLWALLSWKRWLMVVTTTLILVQFIVGFNYLYRGRDGRAEITRAYAAIKDNFESGDKIYAVQLRDYYLGDLPPETEIIDLQVSSDPEFSGSGFVVWEEEKTTHLKPETLEYIKTNFDYLGSGGVEIYRYNTVDGQN